MSERECPHCDGKGGGMSGYYEPEWSDCECCAGEGKVTDERLATYDAEIARIDAEIDRLMAEEPTPPPTGSGSERE